jgi:membrane-associated protease RseP (regulator of RpoE activity)
MSMLSRALPSQVARRIGCFAAFHPSRWRTADVNDFGRRLLHFWIVWSLLLLVHEAGHAYSARHQGLEVRRLTVGVGPVLWRGQYEDTQLALRLVPIAGITKVVDDHAAAGEQGEHGAWQSWSEHGITLAGGVLATLALACVVAGVVAAWERSSGRRWVWGRIVIADAVVLTVFNFLPVPPLDGGRAVLSAVAALSGAPLSDDALFWVQLGGLALAVVPMALWTRWTARIDRAALWWCAPHSR